MAVLASPGTACTWLRPPGFALGLVGLTLIGCAAVAMFGKQDPVAVFSHRVHVIDQGLDCAMCHAIEEGAALPLAPDLAQCALCHDGLDEDKPEHKRAAAFFVPARSDAGSQSERGALDGALGEAEVDLVLRPGLQRFASEVKFDHSAHIATLDENCLACHVGIDESDRLRPSDAQTMQTCVTCHEERGRADSCAVCHSVVGRDWAPRSHAASWTFLHGEASRDAESMTSSDCALCHSQSSCTECHLSTPPANHDEHFRLRGHGVFADLAREGCATCHTSNSCIRCHESTRPISHHGAFGAPMNTHCVSCHFPLASETCSTCHRDAASHALAAPQPAGHVPGANCRLCHGAGAPLPHVDDGSDCSFCHR
ncbi:MAG: cytochrome c3 family protein [Planctomycetota bacterium]